MYFCNIHFFISFYIIFVFVLLSILFAQSPSAISAVAAWFYLYFHHLQFSHSIFNVVWLLVVVIQRRILSNNTLWHRTQKGQTFTWIFIKYSVATVLRCVLSVRALLRDFAVFFLLYFVKCKSLVLGTKSFNISVKDIYIQICHHITERTKNNLQ